MKIKELKRAASSSKKLNSAQKSSNELNKAL
jgi:hypothetical protein